MLAIPLVATPSQTLSVVLNAQTCTLNVYQKFWGLFMDVLVDNEMIIQGVICQNLNYVVRSLYLGFVGDLLFLDTQGTSDPVYTGLGPPSSARFVLLYAFPSELPSTYGQNPFDPNAIADDFAEAFPNA